MNEDPYTLGKPAEDTDEDADASELPLEEDDLDADLVPHAIDGLPLPNPVAFMKWWKENANRFTDQRRYLRGAPYGMTSVIDALLRGPARRRHALALELAIRTRGAHRLSTRGFAQVQQEQIAALRAAPPMDFTRSFRRL